MFVDEVFRCHRFVRYCQWKKICETFLMNATFEEHEIIQTLIKHKHNSIASLSIAPIEWEINVNKKEIKLMRAFLQTSSCMHFMIFLFIYLFFLGFSLLSKRRNRKKHSAIEQYDVTVANVKVKHLTYRKWHIDFSVMENKGKHLFIRWKQKKMYFPYYQTFEQQLHTCSKHEHGKFVIFLPIEVHIFSLQRNFRQYGS